MGNCLRNGSPSASSNNHHLATRKEANDPGSPTLTYASSTEKPIRWFKKKKKKKQKKAGPGSPTFINASSTDYVTGKSYFSETVSEGNEDTIPGKSYFSETVSDGNEDTIPVVTAVKSHFSETVAQGNEGPNPSDLKAWAEGGSKVFTFAELKAATGNFKKENLLVEGSIQRAYKGWIDERTFAPSKPGSGMVVAVKRFESKGGELESEVSYLGRLSHPNLIKLLGFCLEEEKWLLVYEFMPNGSLKSRLFGRKPGIRSLSWDLRLKIVIGAARGLAFLHTSQVIYGAFTPSTILLDQNYNAKLSDFSLAREGPGEGCTHVSTRLIDSFGYIAPEYIETGNNCCGKYSFTN